MHSDAGDDTIAAPATPPGHGGIGVVRVSGPAAGAIAAAVAPPRPEARFAALRDFLAGDGRALDRGLVLWLPAPGSYTGEDTLELHGHGGPAVLDAVLQRVLELGARPARPGEFTERAFLNGRLDLAQAEAVADLIETADAAGARAAMRSLEGAFSRRVTALAEDLVVVRAWVEGALDFPDDEVDFLADVTLRARLGALRERLRETRAAAGEGRRLVEGQTVVVAGAPNAGKSSLLNRLAGTQTAIVTAIPGTTRDPLREAVRIAGVPLTLIDTAGLRETEDPVESQGVQRAHATLGQADRILLVVDAAAPGESSPGLPHGIPVDVVRNKIDLTAEPAGRDGHGTFRVSATTGAGLDDLRAHLRAALAGTADAGGAFSARRRHLEALDAVAAALDAATRELEGGGAAELAAEQLRAAQQALGSVTGEVTSEDLLGEIFGRFCIGK